MEDKFFISILINSIVTLSGVLLAYYFAKRRYFYEKLFDKKLVVLEEIYGKVIFIEENIKKYIYTVGANPTMESLPQKREEILLIQNKLLELRDYFQKKEILLNEDSVSVIKYFIDLSIKVIAELGASIISQNLRDSEIFRNQFNNGRSLMENELSKVKSQLKDDFKKTIKKE